MTRQQVNWRVTGCSRKKREGKGVDQGWENEGKKKKVSEKTSLQIAMAEGAGGTDLGGPGGKVWNSLRS